MSSKTEIVKNALKGMTKEELEKLTTADITFYNELKRMPEGEIEDENVKN